MTDITWYGNLTILASETGPRAEVLCNILGPAKSHIYLPEAVLIIETAYYSLQLSGFKRKKCMVFYRYGEEVGFFWMICAICSVGKSKRALTYSDSGYEELISATAIVRHQWRTRGCLLHDMHCYAQKMLLRRRSTWIMRFRRRNKLKWRIMRSSKLNYSYLSPFVWFISEASALRAKDIINGGLSKDTVFGPSQPLQLCFCSSLWLILVSSQSYRLCNTDRIRRVSGLYFVHALLSSLHVPIG